MDMQWDIICGAVQGVGHAKQELPCQDKTAVVDTGDCHVMALADGAGSARLSHAGAECVTQTLCHHLSREFERLYATNNAAIVRAELEELVRGKLQELAVELNCRLQDLGSTLLLAAIKGEHYILLHLGDGIIAYRKNGNLRIASAPVNGEYANSTVFTSSEHAFESMKLIKGKLGGIDGFVLMSDGSCASLYDKTQAEAAPVLGWLMDLCTYIPAKEVEEGLTESMEEVKAMTDDDCSIAIMCRRKESFSGISTLPMEILLRLTGLPSCEASSRHRLKVYLSILSALTEPTRLSSIVSVVHQKGSRLLKKVSQLMQLHLIKRLADGRYVSLARL